MSLPHAILGLLEQGPMTGYELKTLWFDRTIAHFWSSDHTQIYRTLDKLAEQGLVDSHIEYQDERPNRKVYTITEAGRVEFKKWLGTEQPPATVRDAFMIQLFFGAKLSNTALIELLEREKQVHEERITHYNQIKEQAEVSEVTGRDKVLRLLTVERGVRREQTYVDWLQEAIAKIEHLEEESV